MSETVTPAANVNKYPAVLFAAGGFIYSLLLTAYLVRWGDPANSLHQSALSWAFIVVLAVLGAYGIGQIASLTAILKK